MNEEEIYISLGVEEVEDFEHFCPRATMRIIYLDKDNIKEEEIVCGELDKLVWYLQV